MSTFFITSITQSGFVSRLEKQMLQDVMFALLASSFELKLKVQLIEAGNVAFFHGKQEKKAMLQI